MNWLPFYNSLLLGIFIVSLFLWKLLGFFFLTILLIFSIIFFYQENIFSYKHYLDSFYMFILSEILIFGSLLTGCLWFFDESKINLSNYLEIPLFGTALLLGSSFTVSLYHSNNIVPFWLSQYFMFLTILLGVGFILLQVVEFGDCLWSFSSSSYTGCCFAVISLHLSHVFIGLILLILLFLLPKYNIETYYNDLIVIYWHFVDYVWLFVYFVVYIL
nr:cytochrome c oxidase subunit III [Rhabdosynochus viridisi]